MQGTGAGIVTEKPAPGNENGEKRAFSLPLYLFIVFLFSWPFMIAGSFFTETILQRYAMNATAMVMVAVASYLAGRYIFRDGFSSAGWNRGTLAQYGVVIGLALFLWLVPTLMDIGSGSLSWPVAPGPVATIPVTVIFATTLIPGFGEEFGWRGYMLPRIAAKTSPRRAVIYHSLIWWAWHLPIILSALFFSLLAVPGGGQITVIEILTSTLLVVLLSIAPSALHGVIFAYIWTRTRSLGVATVYHSAVDTTRDSILILVGSGPVNSIWSTIMISVIGIILLIRGKWDSLEEFRSNGSTV